MDVYAWRMYGCVRKWVCSNAQNVWFPLSLLYTLLNHIAQSIYTVQPEAPFCAYFTLCGNDAWPPEVRQACR